MEASRKKSLIDILKKHTCLELRNPNRLFVLHYNKILSFEDSKTIGFFTHDKYIGILVLDLVDHWEINKDNEIVIYIKEDKEKG